MNLGKLLNWNYLVERYPAAGLSSLLLAVLLVIFIGAILVAIYSIWQLRRHAHPKDLWLRLQTWGWSIGLIGLLLIFFRETRALYLSSRLWLLVWLLLGLGWLIYILYFVKIRLPKIKKPQLADAEFIKYLPHKKAHK